MVLKICIQSTVSMYGAIITTVHTGLFELAVSIETGIEMSVLLYDICKCFPD